MAVQWPSTIRHTIRSTRQSESGVEVDKSDDGVTHLRALYANTHFNMVLTVEGLSLDQLTALEDFINTNKLNEIDIPMHPHFYRCRITGDYDVSYSGGYVAALTVPVRGVRL